MTREQVHDLMENELRCDRDGAKCPLVKDDKELIEAYGYVIKALEQEPVLDKIRVELLAISEYDYIPTRNAMEIIDKYRKWEVI